MTVDEVIKLVNAGFTAEDIKGMSNNTKVDEPDVQEEIKEEEVNKVIKEEPKENIEKNNYDEMIKNIDNKLNEMQKNLQKKAIIEEKMPEEDKYDITSVMDDVIRKF